MYVRFWIGGVSQPSGSKRAFTRGAKTVVVDANSKAKGWKAIVGQVATDAMESLPPTREPVSLLLRFMSLRPKYHFTSRGVLRPDYARAVPQRKPDATKLLRCVEDALTGIVYVDDSHVAHIEVDRIYGEYEGCNVVAFWGVDALEHHRAVSILSTFPAGPHTPVLIK